MDSVLGYARTFFIGGRYRARATLKRQTAPLCFSNVGMFEYGVVPARPLVDSLMHLPASTGTDLEPISIALPQLRFTVGD
jgi:hypothetical protein